MLNRIITLILFFSSSPLNYIPIGEGGFGEISAQVAINLTGNESHTSAILDVSASNKGLLIPRISLTSVNDLTTIVSPSLSLLIFNTATAGAAPDNVIPGFYYWDGIKWISLNGQNITGGMLAFANFYALMPGNNAATVAPDSAVKFPNLGTNSGTAIRLSTNSEILLEAIGVYMVTWLVSVDEPGQLMVEINGVGNSSSVFGRAAATSQIAGNILIATVTANSILRIVNPKGNSTALTITPIAGGTKAVSASLVILRIQ
jgi:hypothetical protein